MAMATSVYIGEQQRAATTKDGGKERPTALFEGITDIE
jgi:hypothetical protein